MRKIILLTLAVCCLIIPIAAAYYSLSMSFDEIKLNYGNALYWIVLVLLALGVKLVAFPIMSELIKAGYVLSIIPLFVILAGAITVSLYIEGGRVATVLSDAKASRQIEVKLSDGNLKALDKLIETQVAVVDRKRITQDSLKGLQSKLKTQAEWAKGTSVSEVQPLLALVERITGLSKDKISDGMLILLVGLPMLCMMYFSHCAWILFQQATGLQLIKPKPDIHDNLREELQESLDTLKTTVAATRTNDNGKVVSIPVKKSEASHKRIYTFKELMSMYSSLVIENNWRPCNLALHLKQSIGFTKLEDGRYLAPNNWQQLPYAA